jgi:O-antigen ligase
LVGIGVLVLLCQSESFASKAKRYSTVGALALGLAVIVWQVPTVMERFRDLDPHNIGHLNPRARMAPVLWEIFLRSPIFGSGPDQYVMELTRRAMPYLLREAKTIEAHNLALLLLVETGVIGFLVFAMGLGKTLTAAWRARYQADGLLPLALILPFVIAALLLNNPTSDRAFWIAVAYALAGAA